MFTRDIQIEKEYWLRMRSGGRSRFIWREMVLKFSFPVWLIWTVLMSLFAFKSQPFSAYKIVSVGLFSLPVWLLSGYLTGKWRWKELDEKYSKE